MKVGFVLRRCDRTQYRYWRSFHVGGLRTLSDRQTVLCRVTPSGGVTRINILLCKLDEDDKWFVLDVRSDEQEGRQTERKDLWKAVNINNQTRDHHDYDQTAGYRC